jgi:hypothetical protein
MKNTLFLLCLSLLLCNGCKFLTGKSSKTVDTITADTATEEIIDSADLYTGINNEPVSKVPETLQKASTPAPSYNRTNALNGRYYMIVGCFTVPANADKFVAKLKGMGYDAQIISGQNNFQMVAARSYGSYRESVAEIDKFRNEVTPNAWVYLQK